MRHRPRGIGAPLCVSAALSLTLLAPPPPAAAAPAPTPFFSGFQASGSNGYRIAIVTLSNQVWLEAQSGRVAAAYIVRGKVRAGSIHARFGKLGRIAVRIHSLRERSEGDCLRERVVLAEGAIRFRGERGYTRLRRQRLRGFQVLFDRSCFSGARAAAAALGGGETGEPPPELRLTAISRAKHRVDSVRATRGPGRRATILHAQISERRPGMRVVRGARVRIGGRGSVLTSVPGEGRPTATLRPPKPFAGSATLSSLGPGTSTWSGDMTVWLPGLGRVPLTGRRYAASLCLRAPGKGPCPAEPPVDRPPARPLAPPALP